MRRPEPPHFSVWAPLIVAIACAAVAGSCRVDAPDGALFECKSDPDCGGAPMVCAPRPGSEFGVCCAPSAEVCDGKDNDCNGEVDDGLAQATCYEGGPGTANVGSCRSGQHSCVGGQWEPCEGQILPRPETCNGVDDDCDGNIDNGLTESDPNNCGACGNKCPSTHQCIGGSCVPSSEPDCGNGADDDGDGLIDCADPKCDARACRAAPATFACDLTAQGCMCSGVANPPPESSCGDGIDQDCDGLIDCADPDCDRLSCGTGCECQGSARHELPTFCGDGKDNDGDTKIDCADPDCLNQLCQPSPSTFRCDPAAACSCGGSTNPSPETICGDAIDNDCDGMTDCADPTCESRICGSGGKKCRSGTCA